MKGKLVNYMYRHCGLLPGFPAAILNRRISGKRLRR